MIDNRQEKNLNYKHSFKNPDSESRLKHLDLIDETSGVLKSRCLRTDRDGAVAPDVLRESSFPRVCAKDQICQLQEIALFWAFRGKCLE